MHTNELIPANRRIKFQRSTQQISTPANWRTHKRIDYRQIGVSNSNVQHNRNDYHQSAYQIPTSNTKETITINRRIRFQRSTQQKRSPSIGVSDSNVQHNRNDYHKSAYQIPTFNTTETITSNWCIKFQLQHNRLVHRRIGVPATGDRRTGEPANRQTGEPANRRTGESTSNCLRKQNRSTLIGPTSKQWWRLSVNPLLSTVTAGVDRPCFQLDAFVDHSVRTTSKTACRNWKRAALL